jgi:amino acid transporter
MANQNQSGISFTDAVSIGIGGMIGAGIFSILGVVAQAAGATMWISFLIGGIVALFSTYSYAKLGAKFPSVGGAVAFLIEGFGAGLMSGSINLFMWIGYIIAIALYAQGFSAYFMTFFTAVPTPLLSKAVATIIVLLFALVNILGASSVGRAETLIVVIKVSILILFSVSGLFFIQPDNLAPTHWSHWEQILYGASILFIGYEGFGLVANAAGDMENPQKYLPRALYTSVLIVIAIYIAVSITVVGNLSINEIYHSGDDALAQAAKPFLGMIGFKLIAIAALFSTASAINATLFGAANVSYMIARDGELPAVFSRREWHNATGGLVITTLLVICFILFFNLAGVAMMGSGAFLLIYAAVNAGHLNILHKTGANKWIIILSLLLCLGMFGILEYYTYMHSPAAVYTMIFLLLASFVITFLRKINHSAGRVSK